MLVEPLLGDCAWRVDLVPAAWPQAFDPLLGHHAHRLRHAVGLGQQVVAHLGTMQGEQPLRVAAAPPVDRLVVVQSEDQFADAGMPTPGQRQLHLEWGQVLRLVDQHELRISRRRHAVHRPFQRALHHVGEVDRADFSFPCVPPAGELAHVRGPVLTLRPHGAQFVHRGQQFVAGRGETAILPAGRVGRSGSAAARVRADSPLRFDLLIPVANHLAVQCHRWPVELAEGVRVQGADAAGAGLGPVADEPAAHLLGGGDAEAGQQHRIGAVSGHSGFDPFGQIGRLAGSGRAEDPFDNTRILLAVFREGGSRHQCLASFGQIAALQGR